MFKNLLLKELHLNLKNMRFQVAFVIVIVAFITGGILNIKTVKERLELYNKYNSQWLEVERQQAKSSASEVAVWNNNFLLGPRKNSYISDCMERFIPNEITYNAFNVYSFNVRQSVINPLLNRYLEINWSFIVIFVISLLSLLLTFDSVSGEREAHTLVLCLSNQVSRSHVFLTKWLSVILLLSVTMLIGILVYLLIQLIAGSQIATAISVMEVLLFIVSAFVFISLMTCLGLLCSVISRSSGISLLYAITLWLLFAIIIPNTSILWADKFYPIQGSDALQQKIYAKQGEIMDSYPRDIGMISENLPFMPTHKIRASMNMEIMLSDKEIHDSYYQTMFRQYEKSRNITNVSPFSLFGCIMETITGGGYLRFQQNWNAMHVYQQQFLGFFKSFDAKDKDSPHWYNPFETYSTTRKPLKFEEMPIYSEIPLGLGNRIAKMAKYEGLFLIYIILTFMTAYIIFLKSDVR